MKINDASALVFVILFTSLSVWPFFLSDWEEEQVSSPNILRLIYQGRFLHGNVTLGGEKTPQKKVRLPAHRHARKVTAVCCWKVLRCSHPLFSWAAEQRYLSAPDKPALTWEREERGNAEKEGKGTGQERGKTGVRVDLKQHNIEAERGEVGGLNGWRESEDVFFWRGSLRFSLAFRLFGLLNPIFFLLLLFDCRFLLLMGLWLSLTLFTLIPLLPSIW